METRETYITPNQEVKVILVTQTRRQKAYSKVIQGFMQIAAGLFELIFDEPAPRPSDVLRGG